MSRFVAAAALAALLFAPVGAYAKTFPVPDDNPIATVSIPNAWEPHEYDGGVEGTSEDGGVYVAVEEVNAKDVGEATGDGIEWFAKQGVKIDEKSIKTQDIKINGMAAFDMDMHGVDKDGPTHVSMTLVKTNSDTKFLYVYFWGSDKATQDNAKDLAAIAESLQATK